MSSWFALDAPAFDEVIAAAMAFGDGADKVIERTLHEEAGREIYERINPLIHPSGRTFKGHRASARASDWPTYDKGSMSVTVAARCEWHYLYFPDDGSNTRRHAGNQRMFERGAEQATQRVADMCIENLMETWEG